MSAVFADTFYWIALIDFNDAARRQALALTSRLSDTPIVTTDEVLTEWLTFFAFREPPRVSEVLARKGSWIAPFEVP